MNKMVPKPVHHLEFQMDATQAQSHHIADSSAVDIVFPGHISSDIPVVWTLETQPTGMGGAPNLNLIHDVMGRPHPSGQTVIPLTWELSLDGMPYIPMQLTPDNNLQAIILPGMHTFRIHASSPLLLTQAAGYYHLQMAMQFGPHL